MSHHQALIAAKDKYMFTLNYNHKLLVKNGKVRSAIPKDTSVPADSPITELMKPTLYAWLKDKVKDNPETHAEVVVSVKTKESKDGLEIKFKIRQVEHIK